MSRRTLPNLGGALMENDHDKARENELRLLEARQRRNTLGLQGKISSLTIPTRSSLLGVPMPVVQLAKSPRRKTTSKGTVANPSPQQTRELLAKRGIPEDANVLCKLGAIRGVMRDRNSKLLVNCV